MASSTDIVPRATVRELVDCYNQAVADMTEAFRLLQVAQKSLDARFRLGGNYSSITVTTDGCHVPSLQLTKALARLERDAWSNIFDRLDVRRMMPTAKVKSLEEQIEANKMPPLTEDTAMQLAAQCIGQLGTLLDELVVEVFDWLRPHERTTESMYKRNQRDVVGKRVVLPGAVKKHPTSGYTVHSYTSQRLSCLENVFTALDGKGTVHRNYYSNLVNAINDSTNGNGSTTYFEFRCHKNSNLHLEFLRDDLLAEFNRRAGGMHLNSDKRNGKS